MTQATERTGVAHVPTVRNANLDDLLRILNEQQARKVDLVIPASKLKFADGMLVISGQEMILEDDGVSDPNGAYWPTQVFDDQVAERLNIPTAYLRRLRHGAVDKKDKTTAVPRLDLWDVNINGLLAGRKPKVSRQAFTPPGEDPAEPTVLREGVPADTRSFFLRLFKPEDGIGIARSILSNRFARMDNVDGLTAMLEGIIAAGIDPATLRVYGDLSETRMFVHVAAPEILAAAPNLLEGYRSPFENQVENDKRSANGALSLDERIRLGREFRERGHGDGNHHGFYPAGQEPLVHAGFVVANSEVGAGRWTISPEITVLRCSNGMTMNDDRFARTHLGARMEEGHVEWSADTQGKELTFVTAQTRDVVKAVLSTEYLERKVDELERKAGRVVAEPEKVIEVVAKKLAFTKTETEGILRHFLMAGQMTSGGVMQAVTSYSQTVADVDAAHDLNNRAVEAMALAFASN